MRPDDKSQNNLPQTPEAEDVPQFLAEEKWFGIDISSDFLDFNEQYRPPRYTLSRKGVPFADVGDLHIITGKPGHGKTGLISQLMAAVLCGRFGNTEYVLQEKPKPIVLYVDTEQGKDDTIAIKNRVCTLAGIDYTKPSDQFVILRLRDTEEAHDRWRKILKAIWMVKPTDIFLDGMLDIVKDYNDQIECQPIVRKCMKVATEFDTSLWAVLHENPMVDKLVGTLGSIVQRKVAEIFAVRKVKQCDLKLNERRPDRPEIYFQVKQLKARGKDVADWDFEYVPNAGGWGMPVELTDAGDRVNDPAAERRMKERREADDYFKTFQWPHNGSTYSALEDHLKRQGVTSNRQIQKLFDAAREYGVIFKSEKGKYFYKGIFGQDTEEAQNLPFEGETKGRCPF